MQSLHRILLDPGCHVIELACTLQTTQLPIWAVSGLSYRFERTRKEPHRPIYYVGHR